MKDYPIEIPGFQNQNLKWRAGFFTNSLMANDETVQRTKNRKSEFLVKNDQGEDVTLKANLSFGDIVPTITCNSETYHLAPPVSTGQKIFAAILFLPLFTGGAVGGLFLAMGYMISMSIFRSSREAWVQYLMVLGTVGLTWLAYLMVAVGVSGLIR